jgi:hypothetical protein
MEHDRVSAYVDITNPNKAMEKRSLETDGEATLKRKVSKQEQVEKANARVEMYHRLKALSVLTTYFHTMFELLILPTEWMNECDHCHANILEFIATMVKKIKDASMERPASTFISEMIKKDNRNAGEIDALFYFIRLITDPKEEKILVMCVNKKEFIYVFQHRSYKCFNPSLLWRYGI